MHVNLISPSHENCGCYGNGNSKIVAKTFGTRDNPITIQVSLIKLGICTGGYLLLIHVISFRRHIRIVVAMVTEIVKILHR